MDFLPDFTNTPKSIITILFLSVALIQFFWVLYFYGRIAFHKEKSNSYFPPVSVIIVAKNEEDNLAEFLPAVLEQDYENFEVIVVNHQSSDDTEEILNAFQKKYSHLKIISLDQGKHASYGKKLPLTIGIKGAKHDCLLLTDADCMPVSDQWIKKMAQKFSSKRKIVLGYSPHRKTTGFLNRIIRLDTTFIALNYLSYAKAGVPYMGVGRNLAYTKELFLNNKGFKSHYSIASGDDDLFIQEVANHKNTTVSLLPESFTYSDGKKTWTDWFRQKSRHYATSPKYSFVKRILLGIYPFSLILLLVSAIILAINNWINWLLLIIFLVLLVLKWLFLGLAFKKLEQKALAWGIIFWDIFYAFFIPIVYYLRQQSSIKKWR